MSSLPNPLQLRLTGFPFLTKSGLLTGITQASSSTFSLVYLTSVERVRGVSLCSLERQDSPLLQGLKVVKDPLSKILTPKLPLLLLTGNRVGEPTLTAFQGRSGLQVTQRLSPFPTDVLTNYNDPDLIAPGRLVVSG